MGSNMLSRLKMWFLYSLFGSLIFSLSFWFFMDWELLRIRAQLEMSKASGYDVTIGDIDIGFSGVTLNDLKMVSVSTKEGEKPTRFLIDYFTINSGMWGLIQGEKIIDFKMATLGGTISGKFNFEDTDKKFEIDIKNIRTSKIPWIASAINLPIKGRLFADGKLTYPKQGWRKAIGEFNVKCKKCVLGDGIQKVKFTFIKNKKNPAQEKWAKKGVTLPPVSMGKFTGTVSIKQGKAVFEEFLALSNDGEAELTGDIRLRDPFKFSKANLYFKFKFSDEIKKTHETLEGIELSLMKGKRPDGYFGLSISRQIKNLKFLPSKFGGASKFNRNNRKNRNNRNRSRFQDRDRKRKERRRKRKKGIANKYKKP
jgi:type II secretion system protein N